ncbi:MAG: sugar phosphate isomerase/epimerase family protein [Nitrospirota bacterium]
MKIAVSNIAWLPDQEPAAAALLQARDVRGVEIAPTAIWRDPTAATTGERRAYRCAWARRGIAIVAFQALLYGRPDLTIFESPSARAATVEYLSRLIRLADDLDARVLVFGAPSQRRIAGLAPNEVEDVAASFFGAIGRAAIEHGVRVCIEPIPVAWGGEFVTTIREAIDLVRRVNSEGFGVHVDAAAATAEPDPVAAIHAARGTVAHVHASEPGLASIGTGGVDHGQIGAALRGIGYTGWTSIEMRAGDRAGVLKRVDAALHTVRAAYGTE